MSLLLWVLGCTPGADSGAVDTALSAQLLSPDAWGLAAAADDPWAAEAPTEAACPSTAFGPEGAFFEVETDPCPWGTWTQALAVGGEQGDRLVFTFFHLDLWAPEPAEAVVTLHLGGEQAWELRRPVPSEAGVYEVEVLAPRGWQAGAAAAFHVHNHGSNSYRLGEVMLGAGAVR
jgi:hypothetical protein